MNECRPLLIGGGVGNAGILGLTKHWADNADEPDVPTDTDAMSINDNIASNYKMGQSRFGNDRVVSIIDNAAVAHFRNPVGEVNVQQDARCAPHTWRPYHTADPDICSLRQNPEPASNQVVSEQKCVDHTVIVFLGECLERVGGTGAAATGGVTLDGAGAWSDDISRLGRQEDIETGEAEGAGDGASTAQAGSRAATDEEEAEDAAAAAAAAAADGGADEESVFKECPDCHIRHENMNKQVCERCGGPLPHAAYVKLLARWRGPPAFTKFASRVPPRFRTQHRGLVVTTIDSHGNVIKKHQPPPVPPEEEVAGSASDASVRIEGLPMLAMDPGKLENQRARMDYNGRLLKVGGRSKLKLE